MGLDGSTFYLTLIHEAGVRRWMMGRTDTGRDIVGGTVAYFLVSHLAGVCVCVGG